MTLPQKPYWLLDNKQELAPALANLIHFWDEFREWVESLPGDYPLLKAFARTGRTNQRNRMGMELADAWLQTPSESDDVNEAVESLVNGISWRVISWGRAHNGSPGLDSAELILFPDGRQE